jgi:rubredoxin
VRILVEVRNHNFIHMAQYVCLECGWIYDEALGLPERGVSPGTLWESLPNSFTCGECEVTKGETEKWQRLD